MADRENRATLSLWCFSSLSSRGFQLILWSFIIDYDEADEEDEEENEPYAVVRRSLPDHKWDHFSTLYNTPEHFRSGFELKDLPMTCKYFSLFSFLLFLFFRCRRTVRKTGLLKFSSWYKHELWWNSSPINTVAHIIVGSGKGSKYNSLSTQTSNLVVWNVLEFHYSPLNFHEL